MRKLLTACAVFLVLALTFSFSAGASENQSGRIEGEGFATPDEAILAFAEGLKEGDLDKMVSTFAVETYCERFDMAGYIQRMGAIIPYSLFDDIYPLSGESDGSRNPFIVEGRRAAVITGIRHPLKMIALDRMEKDYPEYGEIIANLKETKPAYGDSLKNMSHDELAKLVSELQSYPDFSEMEVSDPISPVAFSYLAKPYLSETNLTNIMRQALISGADGVTERGLILENENETYLLTMNILKYGDRWYNGTMGGNFMALAGVMQYRMGLIGGNNDSLRADDFDVDSAVKVLKTRESELISQLVPELKAFKEDFDARHEELVKEITDEAGSLIDPQTPIIEQLDKLIPLIEAEGGNLYSSNLTNLNIMSFDEMLEYFAMDNLAEAMAQ